MAAFIATGRSSGIASNSHQMCVRARALDRPFTNPSELTIPRRAIMDPSLRRRVTKSKALPCKNENTIVSEVILSF